MARPSYTDIADADIDLDSPITDAVMQGLRDNCEALRIQAIGLNISEQTTTSATYVTLATFRIFLPDLADYTSIQRQLVALLEVKTTGGTGTVKLTDTGAAVDSDEPTTTSASYEDASVTLTFATGLKGTARTITVSGKVTGGNTLAVKAPASFASYLEY